MDHMNWSITIPIPTAGKRTDSPTEFTINLVCRGHQQAIYPLSILETAGLPGTGEIFGRQTSGTQRQQIYNRSVCHLAILNRKILMETAIPFIHCFSPSEISLQFHPKNESLFNRWLFSLNRILHANTVTLVRHNKSGYPNADIPIRQGVKQRCNPSV